MSYSATTESPTCDDETERVETSQSRPSLKQVKAIIEFMRKHPNLVNSKLKQIMSNEKLKKLWIEMSNNVNSISGTIKSTKAWIKYWIDKKRCVMLKNRQVQVGKTKSRLTPLEQKILNICSSAKISTDCKLCLDVITLYINFVEKNKKVKHEPLVADDQLNELDYSKNINGLKETSKTWTTEADDRHMSMIEKMAEVMDKQATAMMQIAQACLVHSNSMGTLADASYQQALAVDRLSNSFQSVGTSMFDVRNAVVNIDYMMKRCLTSSTHRINANLFT